MIVKTLLSIATASVFVCVGSAHAANLVVNGSFESPTVVLPGQSFGVGSSGIAGWTVIGDTVTVLRANCCIPALPFDGSQYLDLTGPNDGLRRYGGVSQVISTSIGQTYELSFQQGNYEFNSISFEGGTTGIVATAGTTSQTFVVPAVSAGEVWVSQTLTFVASSSLTTISLLGTAGQLYIGLDDVSVSAVPEPSTWLLISLGIVALPLARKRKASAL